MFEGLAGHWTPVELSRRVGLGPHRLRVASEHVRLQRGTDGRVRAQITYDQTTSVPLPVRERGGFVWVFTDARSDDRALPDLSPLERTSLARDLHWETWAAGWDEVLERALVEPHLLLSTAGPTGWVARTWLRADRVERVEQAVTRSGAAVEWELEGRRGVACQEWLRPNGMVLHVGLGRPGALVVYAWCVPATRRTTRVLLASAHSGLNVPAETPPPNVRLSAPSGALVERFRRWHDRYGRRSSAPLRLVTNA